MSIHSAWRNDSTAGVNFAGCGWKTLRERNNAPTHDADVAIENIGRCCHARMANDEIKWIHVKR